MVNTIEHEDDWASPGYCTCGRWGRDRVIQSGPRKGQTLEGCPGLAAVERGEAPPQLDRVIWTDVG